MVKHLCWSRQFKRIYNGEGDPCWMISNAEADCPPDERRPKMQHPGFDDKRTDQIETVLAGPETEIQIPRVG